MSNDNRYLTGYNVSFKTAQDPTLYQRQDPVPFDYIPTSHSFDPSMKSIVYTELQEINNKTMPDMVTAPPGMACFPQYEPSFYTSTNSDMGLCTTSAERTLPSSSSKSLIATDVTNNTNATVMMMASYSDTTIASSPPCMWTPSDSPTSTRSASLNSTNGPHLLPPTLSTSLSYLSPSLSQAHYAGTDVYNDTVDQDQQQDYHHLQHSMNPNSTNPLQHISSNQKQHRLENSIPSTSYGTDLIQCATVSLQSTDMDSKDNDTSQTQCNASTASITEMRRQIHIQSEQKRRAQIKDGFEELRNELPTCLNKKMSKVALLHRTVQHIQHLKSTEVSILNELERLMNENDHLKRLQQTTIQLSGIPNE